MASTSSSFTIRPDFQENELNANIPVDSMDGQVDGGLGMGISPFDEDDGFTDVILIVEGEKLHTSKSLLAFASPVFSCMFTADFKEKTENTIELPEKEFATVRNMLSFLHPGVDFKLTRENVFPLILIAEEYQISVLKTACEVFLLEQWKGHVHPMAEFIVKCIEFAEKCDMRRLLTRCKDSLSDPDVSMRHLKENSEISLQLKSDIFELRIEKLEREKSEMYSVRNKITTVKQRLKEIITPHDEHCRCRVEVKLRNPIHRVCAYCSRAWCSENVSTEAYRNSYKFYCNHKIGYHMVHDATIRLFLDLEDHRA